MAGVNRYTTPREGIVIDPLSVEDYTRAGVIRADNLGKLAKFTTQDLTYDVDAKDSQIIGKQVGQLKQGIDKISEDISSNNITDSTYDMVLGLKKNKNKMFGEHGTVTKAQTNLQKKLLWQQQVKELSVKDKWTSGRTNALLKIGEDNFTGTFNKDGTTNDFEGEYGPGNIDIAARMAEVYGEASKHFTEEELVKYQNGEYKIEQRPGTDGFVLTNAKDGKIAKNLPQLTAAYNTLVAEMGNENTLLGSNVKYFKMNRQAMKDYFKEGMSMYNDTKLTNAQTTASFYENPIYDNLRADAAAAGKIQPPTDPSLLKGKTYDVTNKLVDPEQQEGRYRKTDAYLKAFDGLTQQYNPYYIEGVEGDETKQTSELLGYGPQRGEKGVLRPYAIHKNMGHVLAQPAVDDVLKDEDMMSYFKTTGNPLALYTEADLKKPLYDEKGKAIGTTWDLPKVKLFLEASKEAYNTEITKTVEPVYDRISQASMTQGIAGTAKNEQASGSNSSSPKEEYIKTVEGLEAGNQKIWLANGKELTGDDRTDAIEEMRNATKQGSGSAYTKIGDDQREARFATDENNIFRERKLGAQVLQVDGVTYLVEQTPEMQDQFAANTQREREFGNIEYGRSKQILIRVSNGGEAQSTFGNGVYINAHIVRSAEGDIDSPTGYTRLIKDSKGKVIDRVPVTHEQLRDPWIESGDINKPTAGANDEEETTEVISKTGN